jgi:hypothetical protein
MDHSSMPALANSSQNPNSKTTQKRVGEVAQGTGREFKSQYPEKKKSGFKDLEKKEHKISC